MPIEIRQVTTDDERKQVFQLRYRVYVDEMGRPQTGDADTRAEGE